MDNRRQAGARFASLDRVTDRVTAPAEGRSEICVPLADLKGTVRSLGAVADRLAGATRRVGGLDLREAGDLTLELDAFADHWAHGVRTLRSSVEALRSGLEEVTDAYERHEHELARRFAGRG